MTWSQLAFALKLAQKEILSTKTNRFDLTIPKAWVSDKQIFKDPFIFPSIYLKIWFVFLKFELLSEENFSIFNTRLKKFFIFNVQFGQ